MMKEFRLQTAVEIGRPEWSISHQSGLVTIGSCFAEVLGSQFRDYKFNVLNNPLGTIFNPLTICKVLDSAISDRNPGADLYAENQDHIWLHHDFHSSLWASDKASLESAISEKLQQLKNALKAADLLVITFGTAYAYRHKRSNQIIGNCHKLPADQFVKELLHPDQIQIAYEQLIQKLLPLKRNLRIMLTVSPVRHTRDTLPLNQVSKSILRLICHRLSEKYKHVSYFPSYEIMLDELRDYRFYKEDLIHPSKLAEDYIFEKFAQVYLHPASLALTKEWDGIRQALLHKPLHGHTESQHRLLQSVKQKLTALAREIDVSEELAEVERRIREFPSLR
jgi:hypothetical protein